MTLVLRYWLARGLRALAARVQPTLAERELFAAPTSFRAITITASPEWLRPDVNTTSTLGSATTIHYTGGTS